MDYFSYLRQPENQKQGKCGLLLTHSQSLFARLVIFILPTWKPLPSSSNKHNSELGTKCVCIVVLFVLSVLNALVQSYPL